ncbi:MAG TPA: PH domain-containing protein [Acidimicrobiia bacterium]|nr:PH domain-containing protein [Acidimicrobiia bacterium]
MGYPEHLLSQDEVIETQFRPHWSGILREGLIVLIGVVLAIVMAVFGVTQWWAYAILAVIVVVLIAKGLVRWLTTLHVITNERLIYRAGFVAKQGTEIPLEVIQNVAFNQTLIERIFGTGDLMIESAGTHGQTRYRDIPKPEAVQSLIYRVRETRMMEVERGGSAPAVAESTASQLERLSRLHDEGKLSDAEFEAEKARLLGSV